MNLSELIQTGANVSITVKLEDLRKLFKEISKPTKLSPEFLTRKEVLGILHIDSSTLWNWERSGYIRSYPFGGRKQYKWDDVEQIRTGRKRM